MDEDSQREPPRRTFEEISASITDRLNAHTARFDSLDAQMRSLTRLVGQVLDRLPAPPEQSGD